jgi:radical SAM superfamily enzyme YgiQ (UPF0313 family)
MNIQDKHAVYLHEFNVLMENTVYLPLVSGLLSSYSKSISSVARHYSFMPFIFTRKDISEILPVYKNPAVAAFSTSMWNEQLNLKLAEQIKIRFPDCLIVFGGPQVPYGSRSYFERNPFIDVIVKGYGEAVFSRILETFINTRDFSQIPNISWYNKETKSIVHNGCVDAGEILPDINDIPSPYLGGEFEYLFKDAGVQKYQAIIETNRGCPYSCTYCYWGKGEANKKIILYGMKRVEAEINWCAEHKIEYVFNADANFGIVNRDIEIAEKLVQTKKKHGFPSKFRSCYTKNAENRVIEISALLRSEGLEKGITLSFQSLDAQVIKNVKRININLPRYKELITELTRGNVPIYTELILGLPGETYETWINGVNSIYESGFKGQLFIYPCEVYPNVEMNDPEYIQKFGIRTLKMKMTEAHGIPHKADDIFEYQNVIYGTNSMTTEDWRKMLKFSWLSMLFLGMKTAFFAVEYLCSRYHVKHSEFITFLLDKYPKQGSGSSMIGRELSFYDLHVDNMLRGEGRCVLLPEFGNIYWDLEEAGFLRIGKETDRFYDELRSEIIDFLASRKLTADQNKLEEVILYQKSLMPRLNEFKNAWEFALNIVLRGRKSDTMLKSHALKD